MDHLPFKCTQCNEKFLTTEARKVHKKTVHGVASCSLRYDDGQTITVKRPPNDRKVWRCPRCPASFAGASSLLKEHWILKCHGKLSPGGSSVTKVKDESDSDDDEIVYLGIKTRSEIQEEIEIEQALDKDDTMDVDVDATKIPAVEESKVSIQQVQPRPVEVPQPIPPALKDFLDSTRVPMHHTADIYLKYQYTSDETLDWVARIERSDRSFAEFKAELVKKGNWVAWYAFDEALNRRAIAKGFTVMKITR